MIKIIVIAIKKVKLKMKNLKKKIVHIMMKRKKKQIKEEIHIKLNQGIITIINLEKIQ